MKSKKDMSAIATSILKVFASNPLLPLNFKQVSSRLGITDRGSKEMIRNHLQSMAEDEIINEIERGKYKLNPKYITNNVLPAHYVVGTVDMKQTGKAYVLCDEGGEDVYINMNNTNHALNGDKVKVMVATNAFGMGIDKPDVRVVIHIDSPDSIEAYFQEAGRAGRDGNKAYAVLLFNGRDKSILQRRIADQYPDKEYIKTVYEHLAYFFQLAVGCGFERTFEFNLDKFCRNFKHYPARVESALKILEKSGYIEYSEASDNKARMRFLIGRNDLYRLKDMTDEENAVVVAALRNYSGMFSDYAYIEEALIAQQSGVDDQQTHEILKTLSRKHIIHFIPRKSIPHIKYTQSRVDFEEIVIPMKVYDWRKKLAEKRLEAVVTYAESEKVCRSQQLLNYFGETRSERCGQCDVCIEQKKRTREDKQRDKDIRLAILKLLEDKKPHHIKELYTLDFDMPSIERVLRHMADEEEVYNIEGKITR